jgi:Flp pilus assembly protein TadD
LARSHPTPDPAYDALLAEARDALRAGDLGAAETHAREALQHDPSRAAAYNLLAIVRERHGHHAEAMDMLRAGLAVDPTDHATSTNLLRLGAYPSRGPILLGDEEDR